MNTLTFSTGLPVKYVAAPKTPGGKPTIKDAVIVEIRGNQCLVDFSLDKEGQPTGQHTAQAAWSDDTGAENTFHLPKGAVVEQPAGPATTSSANGAAK